MFGQALEQLLQCQEGEQLCQEQFVWHPFAGDYNDNDDDDDDGTLLQVMMIANAEILILCQG